MGPKIFSRRDVAEHNTKEEPYLVIHDRVYCVKHLLAEHPGGEYILLQHAGENATESFEKQGHSEDARKWMKDFEIGVVAGSELAKAAQSKWYESCAVKAGAVFLGIAVAAGTTAIVVHRLNKN